MLTLSLLLSFHNPLTLMSQRSEGWELLLTPSAFPFLTQRATGTSHFKFSWAFWNFKLKRERETHGQFQARRLLQHQKIPGGSLGLPLPFHSSSWNSEGNSLQSQLGIAFSVYAGGLSRTLWENTLHPQAPVRGFYKASRACALFWVCCQLCMGRKQGVPAPGLQNLIYRKLMMCGLDKPAFTSVGVWKTHQSPLYSFCGKES